ncbi:hypothetical protein [Citrobacter sp. FDAARGOS_156]|uniref:hypothetical protein n=1 Tax=Citrobacter TaxID=544 RepID=UPI001F2A6684|nr:hypothetical protein [Citrobacter sp. FDAARGOS_156]
MTTITREQLRERAREKVKSLEFAVTQTAFSENRAELEEELELARIALASLEAEPVGTFRKGPCGYSPSFHEDAMPLYAAPPAPAVPGEWKQWIADAVEYLEGGLEADGEIEAEGSIEAKRLLSRRDAMLQLYGNSEQLDEVGSWNNHRNTPTAQAGNSPVTPDGWQLVPKEPTAAMNKAGWAAMNEHDAINPTYRAMLAAAPQQEVKSALEHGMQRYAGAMQKLSEGDK